MPPPGGGDGTIGASILAPSAAAASRSLELPSFSPEAISLSTTVALVPKPPLPTISAATPATWAAPSDVPSPTA